MDLLKNYKQRLSCLSRVHGGTRLESLYPNEFFSEKDIAFGLLTNGEFVVATDFIDPVSKVEVGYIAHILMLVGLGYARNETDQNPRFDYAVRGIVKHDLKGDVLFWETPEELLKTPQKFEELRECLRSLLSLNLIKKTNLVYGSGNGATLALGTVEEILE